MCCRLIWLVPIQLELNNVTFAVSWYIFLCTTLILSTASRMVLVPSIAICSVALPDQYKWTNPRKHLAASIPHHPQALYVSATSFGEGVINRVWHNNVLSCTAHTGSILCKTCCVLLPRSFSRSGGSTSLQCVPLTDCLCMPM